LFKSFRSSKNLKNLDLSLKNPSLFDIQSIKTLGKTFQYFNTNEFSLTLSLHRVENLDDKGFEALGNSLTQTKNLKSLNICLANCHKITKDGLIKFGLCFKQLIYLKDLTFEFIKCRNIDDSAISGLSNSLQKLERLTSLKLIFDLYFNSISNQGLLHLSFALPPLINLKNISLSVLGSHYIKSQGIAYLSNNLPKLKRLKRLTLNFSYCPNITGQSLSSIASALFQLKELKELHLDFTQCININDEGLSQLANCLSNSKLLKKLYLDFSQTGGISNLGITYLGTALSKLQRLEWVTIHFIK